MKKCEPELMAVNVEDASRITSLSRSTLYRQMRKGRLRGLKIDGARRFLVSDLMDLLKSGKEADPYYPY